MGDVAMRTIGEPSCTACGAAELLVMTDGSIQCFWCKADNGRVVKTVTTQKDADACLAKARECRAKGTAYLKQGELGLAEALHSVANEWEHVIDWDAVHAASQMQEGGQGGS